MTDYTDPSGRAAVADIALATAATEGLLLLHRRWMWANQQREGSGRLFLTRLQNR